MDRIFSRLDGIKIKSDGELEWTWNNEFQKDLYGNESEILKRGIETCYNIHVQINIDEKEVINTVTMLKSGKAADIDGVIAEKLKYTCCLLLGCLHNLCDVGEECVYIKGIISI